MLREADSTNPMHLQVLLFLNLDPVIMNTRQKEQEDITENRRE